MGFINSWIIGVTAPHVLNFVSFQFILLAAKTYNNSDTSTASKRRHRQDLADIVVPSRATTEYSR